MSEGSKPKARARRAKEAAASSEASENAVDPPRARRKKTTQKRTTKKRTVEKNTTKKRTTKKRTTKKARATSAQQPSKTTAKSARASKRAAKSPVAKQKPKGTPVIEGGDAADQRLRILVTGAVGRLGQLLVRRLHRTHHVIGVDRRPFPNRPKDVVHHALDIRRSKTRDLFRGSEIDAVVHLGVLHDPRASDRDRHKWNVVAFDKLVQYVSEFGVKKLVVLSSANVYGSHPDNPQFLSEEAPLLGSQAFRAMRDLVNLDMVAQSFFWKQPETETVILRPVHILGRVRNAPSNYLRLERPWTLLGYDPMVQVIHERDVVRAIELALKPGARGVFNLKGPGELPLSRLLEMLGKEGRTVPSFAARSLLQRAWRLRMTSFPAPELDFIRYLCMVDDSRARGELGYAPAYSLERTLSSINSER